jgi:hypothetical protein
MKVTLKFYYSDDSIKFATGRNIKNIGYLGSPRPIKNPKDFNHHLDTSKLYMYSRALLKYLKSPQINQSRRFQKTEVIIKGDKITITKTSLPATKKENLKKVTYLIIKKILTHPCFKL